MTKLRVCAKPGCPRVTASTYCGSHTTLVTTTQRGLGADHQRRRAQLLPAAIGTACPLCEKTMTADQALDLDHSTARAIDATSVGDRIVHASCNRSAGARLGNEIQGRA